MGLVALDVPADKEEGLCSILSLSNIPQQTFSRTQRTLDCPRHATHRIRPEEILSGRGQALVVVCASTASTIGAEKSPSTK